MCVHMCICTVYTFVHVCVHTYLHVHTYMYSCVHTYIQVIFHAYFIGFFNPRGVCSLLFLFCSLLLLNFFYFWWCRVAFRILVPQPGIELAPPAVEAQSRNYCWWFSHSVMSDSCNPMDCSPPGSSVHGILQARILESGAISFSRGSSQPRNRTWVSYIAGLSFTN